MTTMRWIGSALLAAALCGCASHTKNYSAKPSDQAHKEAMDFKQKAEEAEKAKNWDRAIEFNKKAIAMEPEMGSAWNNLGLALMHRGHPDDYVEAAQAFKRAADIMSTDPRPYQNLGTLYHDRGFSDEALRYFALGLDRSPNDLDCLRGAIASAKRLARSDEAGLSRLNRALMMETDPQWRQVMEFEKMRVQSELAERGHSSS